MFNVFLRPMYYNVRPTLQKQLYAPRYPATRLGYIAVIYIVMTCQIVAFHINRIGVLVPSQTGINDGVGMIVFYLAINGGVLSHAVLPSIA